MSSLRVVSLGVLLVCSVASANGARVAVHPLDAREFTVEQREWLRAFYDVRLARTPGIQLAGSTRVEDAVRSPKGKDCETKDSCLRHLAEATDSLYAVYARLRREPIGGEMMMTARVVRLDGTVVKSISRRAQPEKNVELLETCRTLVFNVVEALELKALPDTLPVADVFSPLPPPPMVSVGVEPPMSPRKKIGVAVAGAGIATLAVAGEGATEYLADETGARLITGDPVTAARVPGAVPAGRPASVARITHGRSSGTSPLRPIITFARV